MLRWVRIFALLLTIGVSGGCYTLVKQPGGHQTRQTTQGRRADVDYRAETLFTATTSLPWTEVGFARTVGTGWDLLDRVRPDSTSVSEAMSTDFLRQMLVVVTWGVSPPATLFIDDVTASGGKLHVFVRADYGDLRPSQPPTSTVKSPVVVARLPLHDGDVVMHMSPRYAWSEAQRRWVRSQTQWSAIGDVERMRVEFDESDARTDAADDIILD